MPVPIVYRKSGEGNVTTIDFFELADGAGIATLYGATISGAGILTSSNGIYSQDILVGGSAAEDDYTLEADTDYDLNINKPIRIKGNAYVNAGIYLTGVAGTAYVRAILRKVSGGVESDIVAENSTTYTWDAAPVGTPEKLLKLVVPLTLFKAGDTLRLTIMLYGKKKVGGAAANVYYGSDPANRVTDYADNVDFVKLVLQLPVLIDL